MAYKDPARAREYARNYYAENRERLIQWQRDYNERNRDQVNERSRQSYRAEQMRIWRMLRKHGMRPEDWAAMWDAQAGLCYLCSEALSASSAVVDHDHTCCEAERSCRACRRGLAHSNCNSAVGMAGDDPVRLRQMADALEHAQAECAERMATNPIQLELGA